jgi:hypothetical protein
MKRDGWIRRGTDGYRQWDELLSMAVMERVGWLTRGIGGYVKGCVAKYCRGMGAEYSDGCEICRGKDGCKTDGWLQQ